MANFTIREYNPHNGELLGNVSSLSFGRARTGIHSVVKVFDLVFSDVNSVSNLKIGIVASGDITVNINPGTVYEDGSVENGFFGIEKSAVFDSSRVSQPLVRHFAGINGTQLSDNTNNVLIPMRNSNTSEYIYLDILASRALDGLVNGAYRIFYDSL